MCDAPSKSLQGPGHVLKNVHLQMKMWNSTVKSADAFDVINGLESTTCTCYFIDDDCLSQRAIDKFNPTAAALSGDHPRYY